MDEKKVLYTILWTHKLASSRTLGDVKVQSLRCALENLAHLVVTNVGLGGNQIRR